MKVTSELLFLTVSSTNSLYSPICHPANNTLPRSPRPPGFCGAGKETGLTQVTPETPGPERPWATCRPVQLSHEDPGSTHSSKLGRSQSPGEGTPLKNTFDLSTSNVALRERIWSCPISVIASTASDPHPNNTRPPSQASPHSRSLVRLHGNVTRGPTFSGSPLCARRCGGRDHHTRRTETHNRRSGAAPSLVPGQAS